MIPFFELVEGYMLYRRLRQSEQWYYFPGSPIKAAEEQRSSNSLKYVVKDTFVEALWLVAWGHNYFKIEMRARAIPPRIVSPNYMRLVWPSVSSQHTESQ